MRPTRFFKIFYFFFFGTGKKKHENIFKKYLARNFGNTSVCGFIFPVFFAIYRWEQVKSGKFFHPQNRTNTKDCVKKDPNVFFSWSWHMFILTVFLFTISHFWKRLSKSAVVNYWISVLESSRIYLPRTLLSEQRNWGGQTRPGMHLQNLKSRYHSVMKVWSVKELERKQWFWKKTSKDTH